MTAKTNMYMIDEKQIPCTKSTFGDMKMHVVIKYQYNNINAFCVITTQVGVVALM